MQWKLIAKISAIAVLTFGLVNDADAQRRQGQRGRNNKQVVVVVAPPQRVNHRHNVHARHNHRARHNCNRQARARHCDRVAYRDDRYHGNNRGRGQARVARRW